MAPPRWNCRAGATLPVAARVTRPIVRPARMLHRDSAMRVLITDGDERSSLAAARSLVRAGHLVHVAAPGPRSLAGVSRGVVAHAIGPDPLADAGEFARTVIGLVEREGIELLLPMTDPSVEALLERRADLPREVGLPFPDLATYRAASDKARVVTLAAQCGFGIPETWLLVNRAAADAATYDPSFFPGVVKPHRSVIAVGQARRKVAVTRVADAVACRRALSALPDEAFPVLVQKHVRGVGEGFFGMRWGGRMVAAFAHRRLREKPPAGGVSVYRESIPLDPRLSGPGVRLLEALHWTGVAMIECRREIETGREVIMEVNGRFWGSLELAIDAGVDFPALLARCAAGESVPGPVPYKEGVRSRWFWGDVDSLYQRLGERSPGSRRARLRAVLSFLRWNPIRDREEIWRWRDPGPFLLETARWFRAALARLIPGRAGARSKSKAEPRESPPGSGARSDAPRAACPPRPARSSPAGAGAPAKARR